MYSDSIMYTYTLIPVILTREGKVVEVSTHDLYVLEEATQIKETGTIIKEVTLGNNNTHNNSLNREHFQEY